MERSLLGESHPPHMESGYVNVTAEDYLFYLFFGPHEAAPRDAPLVVWSNGGPGCSSMEAATTEMSPLSLFGAKTSGRQGFSHIPTTSAWAWTRHAALLFVDQPRYVGFSTGTGPYVTSSREAGKDMVTFLRAWRRLFPDQAHRSLIFASESYGGHYVPAWVAATLDANAAASRPEDALPLTAIFLGNAVVDDAVQSAPQAWSDYCLVEKIVTQDDRPDDEDSTYEDIEWYLGYIW